MLKRFIKRFLVGLLTSEAKLVLKKYKPKIIAVTGSVGKTSTKDAIYHTLSHFLFVRKNEKSFNTEIGVPLTILGCPNAWRNPIRWFLNIVEGLLLLIFKRKYPKVLILEVGADRPGDIRQIAEWLRPDTVVITRFAKVPVHVEFFASPEEVIEEKSQLVKNLKADGILVLNSDDDDVLSLKELSRAHVVTYGMHAGSDVWGSHYNVTEIPGGERPLGINFKINVGGSSLPLGVVGALGLHLLYPILAAIAVGISQKCNLVEIIESLADYTPPTGRMRILPGLKESVIIDDSYNSSPVALSEALDALKKTRVKGRKIAVIGAMMELGKYSVEEHKNAGRVAGSFVDLLITVGVRARLVAEGALETGLEEKNILQFEDARRAGKELEILLQKDDLILIKGSQAARMERTVEEIMAEPARAGELLVRQEEEWKRKM